MCSDLKAMKIEGVGTVPLIAVEFFVLFSRFECALLASGYAGGDSKSAWVNWDQFAQDIHGTFYDAAAADPEIAVIFQDPPRKLVKYDGGWCGFADVEPPSSAVELLISVRTIRNNLFHGSKVLFSERDRTLVLAGVRTLRLALDMTRLLDVTRNIETAWTYADFGVA